MLQALFHSLLRQGLTALRLASHSFTAKDDLVFLISLSPFPMCWECRYLPSYPVYMVLKVKPRASCTPDKHLTNRAMSPSPGTESSELHFYSINK